MRHHIKDQGVVIVMALFIVALIAAIAIQMLSRTSRDVRRTQLILRSTQANLYAEAGIDWAMEQLLQNAVNHQDNKIFDIMPVKSRIDHVHGFAVQTTIADAQAYLNVNNLSDPSWAPIFTNLIRLVSPKTPLTTAQSIVAALQAWLSPGGETTAVDRLYLQSPIPYRAAHRALAVTSELLLVRGMTPEIYAALEPFITALPTTTPINIQQCPPELLGAILPALSRANVQKVVTLRKAKPFVKVDDFINLPYIKQYNFPADKLTAISSYFLVAAHVDIENQNLILYTLVQRSVNEDQQGVVDRIWQRIGMH